MAAHTTPLMTLEDLERMPDDGLHYELLEGELIKLPPPKSRHCLFGDSRTWVRPDVSFIRSGRNLARSADDYFEGAPDLAIEVYSPSERKSTLLREAGAMLSAGAKAVVVPYPKPREAHVHRHGKMAVLRESDTLTLPDILPGWRSKVARFSED
jgi:Uma2 family endonuclease